MLQISLWKRYNNYWPWYDLSDYIIESDDVPLASRNHDFSLVADDINITVSELFVVDTYGVPNTIDIGDSIQIKSDHDGNGTFDIVIFMGTVTYTEKDWKNHSIKVTIENELQKLKNREITHGHLSSFLDSYETVKSYSQYYLNLHLISFQDLLNALFNACDLGLDWTYANPSTYQLVKANGELKAWDLGHPYHSYGNQLVNLQDLDPVYLSNLFINKNMLYAINQDEAGSWSDTYDHWNGYGYDTATDVTNKKITCWDLVNKLCQLFAIQFTFKEMYTGTGPTYRGAKFYIHINYTQQCSGALGDTLIIDDSKKYEYVEKYEHSEYVDEFDSVYYQYKWLAYSDSNPYSSDVYGGGPYQIFNFHYIDSASGPMYYQTVDGVTIYHTLQYDPGYTANHPLSELTTAQGGKGNNPKGKQLDYYSNLGFFVTLPSGDYRYYLTAPYVSDCEFNAVKKNYLNTTYTTDINLEKKALVQNKINIANRTSEIVEEILL
jgi:hypothetical protein